jgi:DNA-binding XRE family transcriptional regulator
MFFGSLDWEIRYQRISSRGLPMNLPKPIAQDAETVTLRRSDYEALIERLEDVADIAALDDLETRLVSENALADYLPAELVERLVGGESPVRIWREHRGLSAQALARTAKLTPSYVSEIETGRKPGSLKAMAKIARALGVSLEDLVREAD